MLSIIVAIADNNAIGRNNQLLCHLSADLKRFKALTTGHTVIMGRRTFESLPNGALPNRRNIVISTKPPRFQKGGGAEWASSFGAALALSQNDDEVFIIGGAQVYAQALPLAERLYITWIHHEFSDADTFLPLDLNGWKEMSRTDFVADEKNDFAYSFVDYKKNSG